MSGRFGKLRLGQKRDVKVEIDPEVRLAEMGVTNDPEKARKKWDEPEASEDDEQSLDFAESERIGREKISLVSGEDEEEDEILPRVTDEDIPPTPKVKAPKKALGEADDEIPGTDFDGNTPDSKEFVDPAFFRLDISVNGNVYRLAADHILRLRSGDFDTENFDEQLEACAFYRFSLFSASVQVRKQRTALEQDFRRWQAKLQRKYREELSIGRKDQRKEHGLNSRDQPSITKDEVLDNILCDVDDGPAYLTFQEQINDLKDKEDLLKELRDCLHDRGFHLGGIAERQAQHRRKPDFS